MKEVPAFVVSTAGATQPPPATSNAMPPPEVPAPPPATATRPHASPAAAPEPANAPSKQEFWPILVLILVVLTAGIYGLWRTRRNVLRAATAMPGPTARGQVPLLDALKEELFQLEHDRLHGSISAEEYETAKAALNQNLQR